MIIKLFTSLFDKNFYVHISFRSGLIFHLLLKYLPSRRKSVQRKLAVVAINLFFKIGLVRLKDQSSTFNFFFVSNYFLNFISGYQLMFNQKLFLLFLAVVMCSWQLKLDQEKQVASSLLLFQIEPYKNGFFLNSFAFHSFWGIHRNKN